MSISFSSRDPLKAGLDCAAEVNPLTGTVSVGVPLKLSPGRDGFGPALALAYTSSGANSPFGAGWALEGVLSVAVDTRRGLPRYDGSDRYSFAGMELLPQEIEDAGGWRPVAIDQGGFLVRRFRARVDASRIRVEQWVEKATGRVHWRTRDAANTLTIYGANPDGTSRVADPADEGRVFSWLPEIQVDARGNAILFTYLKETREGVDLASAAERSRFKPGEAPAQRYLKSIRYGNAKPVSADGAVAPDTEWHFEVVLDYGDHSSADLPAPAPDRAWPARPDPYSTYRAGFEVRTFRLCRRILMFHRLPGLGAEPVLVGIHTLEHDLRPEGATLSAARYEGLRRHLSTGALSRRATPALRFAYARPEPERGFRAAPQETVENVPTGLAGAAYRWLDLCGEGLPGILAELRDGWYYKPNEGGGRFGPQRLVMAQPRYRLADVALNDFDGDGNMDVAVLHGRGAGYFEYDRESGSWNGYRALASLPHQEAAGGRAQWLDLDGDGRADLVVAGHGRVVWYPARGKQGFDAPVEVTGGPAGEGGLPVADDTQLGFFFADMTGDGLADQVRIQGGRVEYWPNLGHGRFGAPVVMDSPPDFGADAAFDPGRILIADLDGDGSADLLYVGAQEIRAFINAEGNAWVQGARFADLPVIDKNASLRVLDFLGDGTPCLVWSTALPAGGAAPLQFLPLAGPPRPHLLVAVEDGLGREIRFSYESSAQHYLQARREGAPWRTRLPSHVTVAAAREEIDRMTGSRLVQRFRYYDGVYDGAEREFRGFGRVDRFDAPLHEDGDGATAPRGQASCVRSFYFTGGLVEHSLTDAWGGDPALRAPPAVTVERASLLAPEEHADTLRAAAGRLIRREVFSVDADGALAETPLEVTLLAYRALRLQPARGEGQPAAVAIEESETLRAVYEQDASDPRVSHTLVLETDGFGNDTLTAAVHYARRPSPAGAPASPQQAKPIVTARRTRLANLETDSRYELGLPVEEQVLEVSLPDLGAAVLPFAEAKAQIAQALAAPRAFHESLAGLAAPASRLISWEQSFYWNDDLTGALPLGQVGAVTLPHSSAEACFTPELAAAVYGARVDGDLLAGEGGYVLRDGYLFRPSAVSRYASAADFHHLTGLVRPDGAASTLVRDATRMFLVEAHDPLANVTRAEIDPCALAPYRIVDPNGNIAEVAYDPLGVVSASSMRGTVLDEAGVEQAYGQEPLSGFVQPAPPTLAPVIADPAAHVGDVAQAVYYDLDAFRRDGAPVQVVTLAREALAHDGTGAPSGTSDVHVTVTHMDGFGRPLQSKVRVESGPTIHRGAEGEVVVGPDGRPVVANATEPWLASGHVVYDERQLPVRQFEPFFTASWRYEGDAELMAFGVSSVTQTDALGRAVRTDLPNGTLTRTEYAAWEVRTFDANDCVSGSAYHLMRNPLAPSAPEKRALLKALEHHDTPSVDHLDPRGLTVRQSVRAAGGAQARETETLLDATGNSVGIVDPRGIAAFEYRLDMQGRALLTRSADAGERRVLLDIYDRPIHTWDARGAHEHRSYDRLDRVLAVRAGGLPGLDDLVQQCVYGEDASVPDAAARNLRGRLVVQRDTAGVRTLLAASPLGQPLAVEQRMREEYKAEVDWSAPTAVTLMPERWVTRTRYDALGRVISQQTPDGVTRRYRHLKGGGAAELRVSTADGRVTDRIVFDEARYNARGQRERVRLGNGVEIVHTHDPLTFRTARVRATRLADAATLQDLAYTYDPTGNIVLTRDAAQESGALGAPVRNLTVTSEQEFTYDAFYQLQRATGRVHRALLEHDHRAGAADTFRGSRAVSLNDGGAVDRYTRHYEHDLSGNLLRMRHVSLQSWTTEMWIAAGSNRSVPLHTLGGGTVSDPEARFDAAGHCTSLPHLASMTWDFRGMLTRAVLIDRSADGGPDDADHYVYDAEGQRVRKVTERLVAGGVEVTEKLYLDGCEIKRISRGGARSLERVTSLLSDGSGAVASLHRWTADSAGRETDDIDVPRWVYQVANHLGSARLDLDAQGGVIAYEEYFPFGGTAFVAGDDLRAASWRDYRFSGKERDDLTGFYYFGFRYYAPWLCRWLTPDPIGAGGGLNLYQYVLNNPVNLIDPEGLDPQRPGQRLRTRYVTYEQFAAAVPEGYRAQIDPGRRWTGLFSPDQQGGVTVHQSESTFRAAARRATGGRAEIWIYDPRYQEGLDRGLNERSARERAEIFNSIDEALRPLQAPPTPDGAGGAGGPGQPGQGNNGGQTGTATGADGSGQPGGGEHGEDGAGGAGTGAGNAPGDSSGRGDATDTGGAGVHAGDGSGQGSTAAQGSTGRGGIGHGAGVSGRGAGGGGTGQAGAGTQGRGAGAGAGAGVGLGDGSSGAGRGQGAGAGGAGQGAGTGRSRAGGAGGTGQRGSSGGAPGGTGQQPGGALGGVPGGIDGGVQGGTVGGVPGGETGVGAPLGAPGGVDPKGATRGAPGQSSGGVSADGTGGAQSGGEGGQTQQAGGQQGGQAAGAQGGSGQGGQGRGQPESAMDRLARYAGYWHLEFGDDGREGAASGGIPGAFGSINGGAWAQGLFLALTAADVVLTVLTLGELAALKASLKGAMRATGQAMRRLASAAARGLQAVRAGLVDLASGLVGRIAARRGSGSARAAADAISETGLFGGKLYGERRLEALRRYLDKRGVDLIIVDQGKNKAGSFFVDVTGRPQLRLRPNPTEYLVWHELSHYLHYRRIGREAYLNLPRSQGWNAAEQFVFDMLEHPSRWRRLNAEERAHAIWYIEEWGFR
ncbi:MULTISPECIES: SpvB/TcaC N-terminal domain-containing protein [Sorangium]|uniref:Toxin n=1 Tax=Sorangium cellulosum TaxID=56 RepID=A0A4V0NHS0_SORCE|nr:MULTISPECIES: SpvB/TcaC N-terminal domain-containing protein [Sorangium]AUX37642.1 hypothetical protein SOCE836_098720 [Sorangium cellulosum]WCQ96932.1 hypothetical protein NQZ70_09722 [Sorangium sp. Soce836]